MSLLSIKTSLLNNQVNKSFALLPLCTQTREYRLPRDPVYSKYQPPAPKCITGGKNHRTMKWKHLRALKVPKIELPDFHKKEKKLEELTPEEMRAKYKERGILPPRKWDGRPSFISSTGGIFEPYVPPEGDGRASLASKAGAKQKAIQAVFKGKQLNELRKIRQFEEDFDPKVWLEEAEKIYIESHQALADDDEDRLHQVVTEYVYPKVVDEAKHKQIRWTFVKTLEPPRVVHVKTTNLVTKENIFAQLTVRFFTQQTLAVYDRFGRLLHGSEVVARDVLEYVVFEKHISNIYGQWRVHDKIIPDWMPPKPSSLRTYVIPEESLEEEKEKATDEVKVVQ